MKEIQPIRRRKRSAEVNPWKDEEISILISAYNKGRSREQIATLLSRTQGSVANKIRLLIQSKRIAPRRP